MHVAVIGQFDISQRDQRLLQTLILHNWLRNDPRWRLVVKDSGHNTKNGRNPKIGSLSTKWVSHHQVLPVQQRLRSPSRSGSARRTPSLGIASGRTARPVSRGDAGDVWYPRSVGNEME